MKHSEQHYSPHPNLTQRGKGVYRLIFIHSCCIFGGDILWHLCPTSAGSQTIVRAYIRAFYQSAVWFRIFSQSLRFNGKTFT